MFDVQVQHIGDTAVVAPEGELDLATAHQLGAALAQAEHHGAPRVILDLRRLTFVDSSGIGVIVKFKRHFAVEGVRFGVVKGDDNVQRAFAISHVEALLPWTAPPVGAG
jgi:anti-sigma B factor antagonist